jgi:hypothetical protein
MGDKDMLTAVSEFASLVKNVFGIFRKKPAPLPPIQIINVYQPIGSKRNSESEPKTPPEKASVPPTSPGAHPVVIMPRKVEETLQAEPEFMSDDYLVGLVVEIERNLRPEDRLILIDPRYAPGDGADE